MTKVEQRKMIETLGEYGHKMRGRECDDFDMMRKRDRDDEELDRLSVQRLLEMYEKYVPERFR
ncbi:MAG TPA: hypothetical protein VI932_02255 [Bacteroidota bacterium]|nr:hypothetical protein [Bacteroidota bacterium]